MPPCLSEIAANVLVNCPALIGLDLAHTAVWMIGRDLLKRQGAPTGPCSVLQSIGHDVFHGRGALTTLDLSHTAVTSVANLCHNVDVAGNLWP
jgi:hypothetical protein